MYIFTENNCETSRNESIFSVLSFFFVGPDAVLSLLHYLERKMLSRTPKELSRSSSVLSVDGGQRDFEAMISDEPNVADQVSGGGGGGSSRRRTMSLGSKKSRSRTASIGSGTDLRRITLHNQTRQKSREEPLQINQTN